VGHCNCIEDSRVPAWDVNFNASVMAYHISRRPSSLSAPFL
jgi:hypothetical protein